MDERELEGQLRAEGFRLIYVWEDAPLAEYPDHTHGVETTHVILQGDMTLTVDGVEKTYHAGDRFNVPANTVHAARMGAAGCRYIVGER